MGFLQSNEKRVGIPLVANLDFDLWVKGLLFLFPILLVSVRHWASGFFILLCLSSFFAMAKYGKSFWQASKSEWILMSLFALFFVSFLLTSVVNGWDGYATKALSTELRFLLFIPLYLMVRQVPGVFRFFAIGCLLGIFTNFFLVAYEIYILDASRSNGVYGPLFIGPVTVLLAAVALCLVNIKHVLLDWALKISVFAATLFVAAYSSRSALMGMIVLATGLVFMQFKHHRWFMLVILLAGALFGLKFHETTQIRVSKAYEEFIAYVEHEAALSEMTANPVGDTSTGVRLEMGKATLYLLAEKPVFGAGRYAYTEHVKKYVEQGRLNPMVSNHGHPHSMLLAVAFFKGLIGFTITIAMFVYAFSFFMRQQANSRMVSRAGIVFLLAVLVTQATESAVLIKGNFIAVFLVILTVLFAYKMGIMQQPVKRDA